MQFIKTHDEKHYDALVSRCDPNRADGANIDTCGAFPERTARIIKLFDLPVSAGFGNRLENDEPYTDFETDNPDADYALTVSGDSMEPDIPDSSFKIFGEVVEIIPDL